MLIPPVLADGLNVESGTPALQVQRTYTTSDGLGRPGHDQYPSRVPLPSLDDDAAGTWLSGAPLPCRCRHDRKLIGGRWVRWDDERAADAYARGWWVRDTLADSLRDAAQRTPQRVALIDGERRLDCQSLCQQATTLAHALHARMPPGSVVSFMLPNWHEAAVIYLAATLAGMVANPILPSMRDRELRFILEDADSRMVFAPARFGRHDYTAMLGRVTAQLESPPRRGGCARGSQRGLDPVRVAAHCAAGHQTTSYAEPRRRADDPLHVWDDWTPERCTAQP